MRSKVDLKNDLEISGLRNSVPSIIETKKTGERAILGGITFSSFVYFRRVRWPQPIPNASSQSLTKMPGSFLFVFF